jgi:hypothetical protein
VIASIARQGVKMRFSAGSGSNRIRVGSWFPTILPNSPNVARAMRCFPRSPHCIFGDGVDSSDTGVATAPNIRCRVRYIYVTNSRVKLFVISSAIIIVIAVLKPGSATPGIPSTSRWNHRSSAWATSAVVWRLPYHQGANR